MSENLELVKQNTTKRPGNPNWLKGKSGNPNGRPVAPEIEEFRQALRQVRKRTKNKPLLYHAVERAYHNDLVLIALLKKLLPDKVSKELTGEGAKERLVLIIERDGKITQRIPEEIYPK